MTYLAQTTCAPQSPRGSALSLPCTHPRTHPHAHLITVAHAPTRGAGWATLATTSLFSHLPKSHHSQVADAMFLSTFEAGESIIKQGDSGNYFYIVDEGTCSIFKATEDGKQELVRARTHTRAGFASRTHWAWGLGSPNTACSGEAV